MSSLCSNEIYITHGPCRLATKLCLHFHPNAHLLSLDTDQSRQELSSDTKNFGYAFLHGKKSSAPISGWKNNLYGDGHAESRRARISSFSADGTAFTNVNASPDEVQPRWGNASGYQMW